MASRYGLAMVEIREREGREVRYQPGRPPHIATGSSLVWSEDVEVVRTLMQLDDKDFADAASYRLNDCLGK